MEQSNARVAGSKEHVSKQNKTQATNIVRSKAEGLDKQPLLKIAPQAQIKLSNFVTSGQKDLISDKVLDSAKKKVGSKIPTQLKGTSQNHGPKKVANEALMTKSKGSMQNHNPQKQPMTKVVFEEVGSPMKITEHNELGDEELEELENEEEEEDDDDDEELENENEDQEENGENNGKIKKKTRGPTQCLKIHGRKLEERVEVIFDDEGEPGIVENDEDDEIWGFVQRKYIIPEEGRKAIMSRINGAWKRYKWSVKRDHYLKYSNLKDRLKHRPKTIPPTHFKILLKFWDNNIIQNLSKKNIVNRAKQRFNHRMGPKNFATIRKKLREKKGNGEEPNQAEMLGPFRMTLGSTSRILLMIFKPCRFPTLRNRMNWFGMILPRDNWLGYKLEDSIDGQLPDSISHLMAAKVADDVNNQAWTLSDDFRQHFPNIANDIQAMPISYAPEPDELVWNDSPSDDNLVKRGFLIVSCCCLCGREYETADHLFLRCPFITQYWNWLSALIGRTVDTSNFSALLGMCSRGWSPQVG
ncbi:hypothetical protein P8452_31786 [Trifolium repens]|nr:hypothetical protein P8452_31786 [Trifolium repens]